MSDPVNIGSVDELDEGETAVVHPEHSGIDRDIMIVHAEDGHFYALDDECTHERVSLAGGFVEGDRIECPMHSSQFCLKNGKVMGLPATEDTRTHKLEVVDGELLLYPDVPTEDAGECSGDV